MQSTTLKSKMESLVHNLPENTSIEDAMEKVLNKQMLVSPFLMKRQNSDYVNSSIEMDSTGASATLVIIAQRPAPAARAVVRLTPRGGTLQVALCRWHFAGGAALPVAAFCLRRRSRTPSISSCQAGVLRLPPPRPAFPFVHGTFFDTFQLCLGAGLLSALCEQATGCRLGR